MNFWCLGSLDTEQYPHLAWLVNVCSGLAETLRSVSDSVKVEIEITKSTSESVEQANQFN